MGDKVQVEIKAPVATIILNKPERLNALDVHRPDDCRSPEPSRRYTAAVCASAIPVGAP